MRAKAESTVGALLVIDVQQGLFAKSIPVHDETALLANINLLIDGARAAGAAVVFVQHANNQIPEGSDAWQLHPRLHVQDGDMRLNKSAASAFKDTGLRQTLAERGVGAVAVAGLVTHGCVKSTCLDASSLGFRVTLAGDAHSSFNRNAKELRVEWNGKLAGEGIEVLPSGNIVFRRGT